MILQGSRGIVHFVRIQGFAGRDSVQGNPDGFFVR